MAATTDAMVDGINNGSYLVNFVGHGGPLGLGEGMLKVDHINALWPTVPSWRFFRR